MYFRNEHHRQAFRDGMKKTNRKDIWTMKDMHEIFWKKKAVRTRKTATWYICEKIRL